MNISEINDFLRYYKTLFGLSNLTYQQCQVGIDMCAEIKMLKKHRITKLPNPFNVLFKNSTIEGFIGIDYEEEVNINRELSGDVADFNSMSLPWGEWHQFPFVIKHKDSFYLRITHPEYITSNYILDTVEVNYNQIEPYISKPSSSESEVKVININIANINNIKVLAPF